MERSECKKIVEAHLKDLMWELAVQNWQVNIRYQELPERTTASVELNYAYEWAILFIDPDKHETTEDVLKSLRHELIHLLLGPIEAYRLTLRELIKPKLHDAEAQAAHTAIERTVLNIERIFEWGKRKNPFKDEVVVEDPKPTPKPEPVYLEE